MFTSTRKQLQLNASECIIKGISDEGGLCIYNELDKFNFNDSFINISFFDCIVNGIFKFLF